MYQKHQIKDFYQIPESRAANCDLTERITNYLYWQQNLLKRTITVENLNCALKFDEDFFYFFEKDCTKCCQIADAL